MNLRLMLTRRPRQVEGLKPSPRPNWLPRGAGGAGSVTL